MYYCNNFFVPYVSHSNPVFPDSFSLPKMHFFTSIILISWVLNEAVQGIECHPCTHP